MTTTEMNIDAWAAFTEAAKAVQEEKERLKEVPALFERMTTSLRLLATDEIDAAHLAADMFAFKAYSASSLAAFQLGLPSPTMPKFSSTLARTIIRRSQMLLVSLVDGLTKNQLARLAKILATIEQNRENETSLWELVRRLLTMHPDEATRWIGLFLSDEEVSS